ncbi:MAG: transposase [Bacteriovoracaceae bacterium]|nr:transposase [Bacteriovoracaceae bacterium]
MSRKILIRSDEFPYHVTCRSNNREWFEIPTQKMWELSLKCLAHANQKHPITLISFVLMSNHYHMLLRTPEANIDRFMYEFNKNLSLVVRNYAYRENRVFGGRYKWCLIRSHKYLFNCYKYVYQNPKRAKIVKHCEDYPYSTLYYIRHDKTFPLIIHDLFGFKDEYGLLKLNHLQPEIELTSIRKALKKSELNVLKHPSRRTPL